MAISAIHPWLSVIGIVVEPEEELVAREFFELFKTPWAFFRDDVHYDIVLCTRQIVPDRVDADLLVVYGSRETTFDVTSDVALDCGQAGSVLVCWSGRIPIYGNVALFRGSSLNFLTEAGSGHAAVHQGRWGSSRFVRVGYDLFREVGLVLTEGQSGPNAVYPTVDSHIGFLRDLIIDHDVPLVEIPPVPHGHPFIACLTHDVDHASIRRHKFDSTVLGFLYRATFRSLIETIRGRMTIAQLLTNWLAATKLPLIHLGWARDFWYDFDRYLEIEEGRPSTFFVVPFERYPGQPGNFKSGAAPNARATAYDITHVAEKVRLLAAAGSEIGLHGIDAWCSETAGRVELNRIAHVSGGMAIGVRMHWLYLDKNSPRLLESAGFSYDSTVGYNDTVGYRAGTGQAFKPLGAEHLLEVPMHIMDTAMFYSDYLNLSRTRAWELVMQFLKNALRDGGVLTFNWHDRSIAPERLWGLFYSRILAELSATGAWFATAGQVVGWFRKRRSVVFEQTAGESPLLRIRIPEQPGLELPALRVRCYLPRKPSPGGYERASRAPREIVLDSGADHLMPWPEVTGRCPETL